MNEIFRVTGVLEDALTRNGSGWLVGDKCTYADLSFVTWAGVAEGLLKEHNKLEGFRVQYPRYVDWMHSLGEQVAVKKVQEQVRKGRAELGLK